MKVRVSKRLGLISLVALVMGVVGFIGARYIATSSVSANQVCQTVHCVELRAQGALPDTLAVPVGSYVQFNSADGKTHSLSLGKGGDAHDHTGPFTSGDFGSDEAWKVHLKEPGTFHFHDHYNPNQNILVVVYQPDGDRTIKR